MENAAYIAVAIFVIVYILIISEKIQRTVVGIVGAMLMILAGILSQEQAISHIDFNTIGLLIGMMILLVYIFICFIYNFCQAESLYCK